MNYTLAAVTRFNNRTWEENQNYRVKHGLTGCCYGTPVLLQEHIAIGAIIYVIEMNNEKNKIMGIGLIKNHNRSDKRYRIYSDGNYNRFNYQSEYRLDRTELKYNNKEFMKCMELILFKGYTHMKRGHGIQLITKKKYNELKYSKPEVLNIIREMFINKYHQ